MTIPELLGLSLDQLERLTPKDIEREFGHLVPAVRTPLQGMKLQLEPGAKHTVKATAKVKQEEFNNMMGFLKANKHLLQ